VKPLLVIMNPRRIPAAMESITALKIDKLWVQNFTYTEISELLPGWLAQTDHDVIGTLADDTIVTQAALDLVLDAYQPGAVYTGYCNLYEDKQTDDDFVNITKTPLIEMPTATWECYDWATKHEVEQCDGLYRSYFAGDSLSFHSREMWQTYPFQTASCGQQGDYALCVRLQRDNVPIYAVPGASILHLKQGESTTHHEGGTVRAGGGIGSIRWDLRP
jgi:GT2 family glycosyltransferase